MNMNSYLERRESRMALHEMTQLLVFGLGIGTITAAVAAYKFFLVQEASDGFWQVVGWGGVILIVLTLIYPYLWLKPQQLLHKVGNWIGHQLMTLILVVVYFAFFFPVGALLRAIKGAGPIYSWRIQPPAMMEGWHRKEFAPDIDGLMRQGGGAKHRIGIVNVLIFFAQRGHYFLLPVLLVLVALGIALFFLQTSALAPLVYTLF